MSTKQKELSEIAHAIGSPRDALTPWLTCDTPYTDKLAKLAKDFRDAAEADGAIDWDNLPREVRK